MNIRERIKSWLGIKSFQSIQVEEMSALRTEVRDLREQLEFRKLRQDQHGERQGRHETSLQSVRREVEELGMMARKTLQGIGGVVWTTQTGYARGIAFLSDNHLATLGDPKNGWARGEVMDAVQAEIARRKEDDMWCKRKGNLSLRDRVTALEEWEEEEASEVFVPSDSMVGGLSLTGRTLDTKCPFDFQNPEGRQHERRAYKIFSKAEAREFPNTHYLSQAEHDSNQQGHNHPAQSYNERVADCQAGRERAEAERAAVRAAVASGVAKYDDRNYIEVDYEKLEMRTLILMLAKQLGINL